MSKFSASLVLAGAVTLSCAATYILTKAKYEKKKPLGFQQLSQPLKISPQTENNNHQEKGDLFDYAKKYSNIDYTQKYKDHAKAYTPPEITENGRIERVSQDIFDTSEYDDVTYTLWADGVLTDENDQPVSDTDANVGIETIERFNEFAVNDSVYVLNHEQKIRYEILKDLRMFTETVDPIDLE